jgi:hypothetical protein
MREEIENPRIEAAKREGPGWLETGWAALRLGLTSFGGPAAHIGYRAGSLVIGGATCRAADA